MDIGSSLIISLVQIFSLIIDIYVWIIIISALISWVRPDPYNPIVQILYRLSEPAYALVKRFIPTTIGSIDLAPLIIILLLKFIQIFLSNLILGSL
ncbi:YggT family protein [Campylobacter insulaenigrae]|uniref:Putative membrane protein, YGGT family n=1 Tax=Campylobacter insulaenigrae NCTC 12927 TaxID=1031564 RepID=A0A0A8H159_9BACT|nr:YggT family protein [Campylobacter insulaenigrae]AJC87667.1 putative membrane protein, YGGT family [Campylobacter insulaenigrae NCTC 12927]MCR6590650.1 YggT family protein [Campylobacter insulaenigrae]MCR6592187.1 YggT family protein [Campylobacter insulaenigrae]VEH93786.1 Integral membrane protein YggT, involved in response to extracytoplasmic stress (osmotic shock) [Campylobacter insulaenigrae]VEJ53670.1 Integral membrane protein YggT, involved in response to extracytoplasmic stress (osmo